MRGIANKRNLLFKIGFGLVLALVFIYVINFLNQPAQGTVSMVSAAKPKAAKPVMLTIKGKTVQFQYLNTFHRLANPALSSQDIEKFSLIKPQTSTWDLGIQIRLLPSGQLSDDGSYNFRRLHPSQYELTQSVINGQAVSIMSDKSGGFGEVAFEVHNGLIAEIALTCGDNSQRQELQQSLQDVLMTWQWLN